jgi:hypothetical protein
MKKTNKYEKLLSTLVNKCNERLTPFIFRAQIRAGEANISLQEAEDILRAEERVNVYPEFFLAVLGDALARKNEWALSGTEAIEYAIISEYSWSLSEVRQLSPRDKWLVLYEHWCQVELDPLAQDAWMSKYKVPLTEDGSAHWRDQV